MEQNEVQGLKPVKNGNKKRLTPLQQRVITAVCYVVVWVAMCALKWCVPQGNVPGGWGSIGFDLVFIGVNRALYGASSAIENGGRRKKHNVNRKRARQRQQAAPRLSPNKTVIGAIGGIIGGVLGVIVVYYGMYYLGGVNGDVIFFTRAVNLLCVFYMIVPKLMSTTTLQ